MASEITVRNSVLVVIVACLAWCGVVSARAQERPAAAPSVTDYVVGPQDVLTITSYDQADLSGKFTLEADGTFTFPLIGRVNAGGLTLRALEGALKKRLKGEGFFNNPQITVSVETYRSQKIFVVGEVRTPGAIHCRATWAWSSHCASRLDAADGQRRRRSSSTHKGRIRSDAPGRTPPRRLNGSISGDAEQGVHQQHRASRRRHHLRPRAEACMF